MERDEIVIKHSRISCGGSGVSFCSGYTRAEIGGLLKATSVDIIIQEPVIQHTELARLHRRSVNTLRIVTLLFRDTVSVLSSVLRMGVGNMRKDNVCSGGIVCGISKNGKLKNTAFDKLGNQYDLHPEGVRFSEIQVPKYDELERLAVNLQYRFPYCKMISWDFAINTNGDPVLIEANLSRGELDFHQLCNGPLFGDMTSDIVANIIKEYL